MRLFLILSLMLLPCFTGAQVRYVNMEHLGVNEGLPSSIAWKVLRDEKGFMWFATDEGIARYDGIKFTVLRSAVGDTTSFESNSVKDMILDHEGIIWAISKNSLIRIDPSRLSVTRVVHLPPDFHCNLKTVQRLTSVREDDSGNLWITSTYGLFVLDVNRKPVKHIIFDTVGEDEQVNICNSLCFDHNRKVWVSHVEGIWVLDQVQWKYSPIKPYGNQYNSAILFHRDKIWVGADSLYRLNPDTYECTTIPHSGFNNGWMRELLPDQSEPNLIWCAFGYGGFAKLNLQDFTFTVYSADKERTSVIPSGVHDLFQDHESIWLATSSGIYRYYQTKDSFIYHDGIWHDGKRHSLVQLFPDPREAGPEICTAITPEGVFKWNAVTGETQSIGFYRDHKSGDRIESVNYRYVDTDGTEYLSVGYKGIYKCVNGKCKLILADEEVEPGDRDYMWYTSSVGRDKSGKLWIAAESRLVCISPDGKKFINPPPVLSANGDTLMAKPSFRKFIFDGSGNMWLISEFSRQKHVIALFRFDPVTEGFQVYYSGNGMPDLANIFGITFDGHYIWCAGEGGAFRFTPDRETPLFEYISSSDWLPSEMCNDVLSDQRGRVWISTRNGLVCWTSDEDIRVFSQASGLIRNGIGQMILTNGGHIVLPHHTSFNTFHPDNIPARPFIERPVITDIFVNGEKYVSDFTAPWIEEIDLEWYENTILFKYSALQFQPGVQVEYSYLIEGIDQDWITTSNPSITITNLPHGKRKISLRARVRGQIWSQPTSIQINIATAWFRSWWFYSLILIASAMLLYSLYRFRIRQILKVQEVKNRIASDLHDEVGSSLSSLALYADIMSSRNLDEQKRNQIIEKIRETASGSMESMRDIIWSARNTEEDLQHIIQRLERTGHDMMEGTQITFMLEAAGTLGAKNLAPEWRKNVLLIFKETVNNARKYSGASIIKAKINVDHKMFELEITDNGKGFNQAEVPKGNGLENIVRRAQDILGKAEIVSVPGQGTRVRVILPMT